MRFRGLLCSPVLLAFSLLPSAARADTFTLKSVLLQGTLNWNDLHQHANRYRV